MYFVKKMYFPLGIMSLYNVCNHYKRRMNEWTDDASIFCTLVNNNNNDEHEFSEL